MARLRIFLVACMMIGLGLDRPGAQEAIETVDPYRIIGVVWRGETEVEAGFRDYLNERGIPFTFTLYNLDLDVGNAPAIVEEIKRAQPDLVYTWGTGTTRSIFGQVETEDPGRFVRDIPGVFTLVAYPIQAGIVNNFESPGRSVSGVSFLASVDAQLNTILAYRPFRTLGVIYDATSSNSRISVEQLRSAAPRVGMSLVELPVPLLADSGKPDPAALPDLIWQAAREGVEILYMGPDSFLTRHAEVYTSTAIAAGLPTFAATEAPLRVSRAMFGLVSDYHILGKLTAVQAERILVKGQSAEELPVARLSRYKLWINMDVVHELGVYPPMDMISVASFQNRPGN